MTLFLQFVAVVFGIILLCFIVYIVVRFGSAAYFRSKYEALSKHFKGDIKML